MADKNILRKKRNSILKRIPFISILAFALLLLIPFTSATASRVFNEKYNDGSNDYACEDESYTVNVNNPGPSGYVIEENLSNGWAYVGLSEDAVSDCAYTANKVVCNSISSSNKILTLRIANSPGPSQPGTAVGVIYDQSSPSGVLVSGSTGIMIKTNTACDAEADLDNYYLVGINVCGCASRTQQDCDDTNPSIHPGAAEVCGNGIDENCNGMSDDVCPSSVSRQFPASVIPNNSVDILLNVQVTGPSSNLAIDESFDQSGFDCIDASDSGYCAANGHVRWIISNPQTKTINYTLYAKTEGTYQFAGKYQFQGDSETTIGGDPDYVVYTLASLQGIVNDMNGNSVDKATVTTYPSFFPSSSVQTAADGSYSFAFVPTGTYYVGATKNGYIQDLQLVTVSGGVNVQNFFLQNGSCNADCTDSFNRCNKGCQNQEFNNGTAICYFYDDKVMNSCTGKLKGTTIVYNTTADYTYLVSCCEGTPYQVYRPQTNIEGSMKDLIKYTKIVLYQAKPVKLIVAVWD